MKPHHHVDSCLGLHLNTKYAVDLRFFDQLPCLSSLAIDFVALKIFPSHLERSTLKAPSDLLTYNSASKRLFLSTDTHDRLMFLPVIDSASALLALHDLELTDVVISSSFFRGLDSLGGLNPQLYSNIFLVCEPNLSFDALENIILLILRYIPIPETLTIGLYLADSGQILGMNPLRSISLVRDAFGLKLCLLTRSIHSNLALCARANGVTSFLLDCDDVDISANSFSHLCNSLESQKSQLSVLDISLGHGIKSPTFSELRNLECARKSITAATDIPRGTVLTEENLSTKRPATGLSPMLWDQVIGTPAKKDFSKDDCIEI